MRITSVYWQQNLIKMITISSTYDLKWQLSFANEYKFSSCGKCFNTKRGKEIKRVLVGYSIGFCIKGKFYTLNKLRNNLEKIQENKCPF